MIFLPSLVVATNRVPDPFVSGGWMDLNTKSEEIFPAHICVQFIPINLYSESPTWTGNVSGRCLVFLFFLNVFSCLHSLHLTFTANLATWIERKKNECHMILRLSYVGGKRRQVSRPFSPRVMFWPIYDVIHDKINMSHCYVTRTNNAGTTLRGRVPFELQIEPRFRYFFVSLFVQRLFRCIVLCDCAI